MENEGELYTVRGQSRVAVAPGRVRHVRLIPEDPPVPEAAMHAIQEAEWVVLGPGSWYTSLIPHLLVSQLHRALVTTDAHRALVLNLARQRGETDTMSAADHVRVLRDHAPDLKLDVVIADPTAGSCTSIDNGGRGCCDAPICRRSAPRVWSNYHRG